MTTNYERIKNMNTDKMAEFIRQEQLNAIFTGIGLSVPSIKQWLDQEVTNDN